CAHQLRVPFQSFQSFNRFAPFITGISPFQTFQTFNRCAPFKTFQANAGSRHSKVPVVPIVPLVPQPKIRKDRAEGELGSGLLLMQIIIQRLDRGLIRLGLVAAKTNPLSRNSGLSLWFLDNLLSTSTSLNKTENLLVQGARAEDGGPALCYGESGTPFEVNLST